MHNVHTMFDGTLYPSNSRIYVRTFAWYIASPYASALQKGYIYYVFRRNIQYRCVKDVNLFLALYV